MVEIHPINGEDDFELVTIGLHNTTDNELSLNVASNLPETFACIVLMLCSLKIILNYHVVPFFRRSTLYLPSSNLYSDTVLPLDERAQTPGKWKHKLFCKLDIIQVCPLTEFGKNNK